MADVLKEVKILFEGDDRVSKVITGISGNLDQFASRVQGATQPLADLAATALKAEAGLTALAVAGLAYAFNESKKFEGAVIELQKVLGDESGSLDEAKRNAFELSDAYGQSSESVLRSTADFKQAGFDINEAMLLTKSSMDLVIAGSIDASQASEILIATLKGFKAPGEEAARVVDILNEVSNQYATDVQQLGIGMSQLSPIARLMGFSFEETAGILTPVIEVFRDGSEAATALKTGLLRIVDDRKPVQDALAAIGVSQVDLNGNLRSGKDILYDVAQAFKDLTPEQQIFFAQNLVGIEQAGRMVEVFSNLANVQEVTAVAMKASGSAAQEVALRLQSAEVSVNRFITGFQNLGIAVGDQFRLAAKEAIDGGTAVENALRNMVNSGTFSPVLDLVSDFARQLGADLKTIAQIMPEAFAGVDWSKLTASIRNVGGEVVDLFEAAFGDVDLTTVEGLQSAVQRVVDGIAALNNVVAGILNAWEPFVRAIAAAAEEFSQVDASTQTFAGNILGVGQVVNQVAKNFDILTGSIQLISVSLGILSGTTLVNALGGFTKLGTAIAGASTGLQAFLLAAAAVATGELVNYIADRLLPGWEKNRGAIADNISVLSGASDVTDEWIGSSDNLVFSLEQQEAVWGAVRDAITAIPDQVETEVSATGTQYTKDEIEEIVKAFAAIGEKKEVTVSTVADTASIERVKNIIWNELPDGTTILIQTDYDEARLAAAEAAINKAAPDKKEVEIMLKGDIEKQVATIEAQAKQVQSFFEYKAKVDVAEVTALFSALETQSTNVKDMFESTGDVIGELASAFADVGGLARLDLMELMEEESRRRDALLIEQSKLTDAQIKYLEARSKAMQAGDGIITIQADGLAPELELVLQKIIQLTQIRANEEGLSFLLGVGA